MNSVDELRKDLADHVGTEQRFWTTVITTMEGNTEAIRQHAEVLTKLEVVLDAYTVTRSRVDALKFFWKVAAWFVAAALGVVAAVQATINYVR